MTQRIIVRKRTTQVIWKAPLSDPRRAITEFQQIGYEVPDDIADAITPYQSTYDPAAGRGNQVGRFVRRAPNASALLAARREAINGEFLRLARVPELHWGYTGRNAADGLTGLMHWLFHLSAAVNAGILARRSDAPIEAMQQIETGDLRAQFVRIRDGSNLGNWQGLAVSPNERIRTDALHSNYTLRTLDGAYNLLGNERIPAGFDPALSTLGL